MVAVFLLLFIYFREPFPSLHSQHRWWSRGRRREIRDLAISRFDTRAQFMNFEFNCRTSDNVELVLEGCFFWEVPAARDPEHRSRLPSYV